MNLSNSVAIKDCSGYQPNHADGLVLVWVLVVNRHHLGHQRLKERLARPKTAPKLGIAPLLLIDIFHQIILISLLGDLTTL